ncbi:hypothetical protein HBI18_249840 [Parastagonospora nodorum]|nr:hypothetical protein HBI18_249840 [Parastagonospora nodorum]
MINTDNLDGLQSSYVTLAASIYGNDIAFYGCSFDGWQDTLLTGATAGHQYYESCYIGGAIDFIWGHSKAYFKGCTIGAMRKSSCVTAHNRASSTAVGGYIFDQCLFTATPGAPDDLTNSVYLGRPYSQYALVVVKNSYLDKTIIPAGWKMWSAVDPRTGGVTFAEFNNSGPSNWENNATARQNFGFATLLTSDTYSLSSVMDSTEWIDMTYWNSIVTPQPLITVPISKNITVNGTSVFNWATLDAAPVSSKVNATIFIYPGVYKEQLILNKSGTSGSNTDGATVCATGNIFHAFNINFRNNFGTTQNIASLAFAVKSSKYAALYGCQIYGNQDTLSVSGNLFTFKTYIEGNVDFIYGSGSAYFLALTISPNEDMISIIAHKRAANVTNAGFVFDQCTLKPAPGAGPFTSYQLGNFFASTSFIEFARVDSQLFSVGIGSAQTCGPISSTISASVVPSAFSTSVLTSSLPVVTAFTTTTVVEKLPVSTLITASEVTSITVAKITETLSITAADVTKTSVEKDTITISVTSPDITLTLTSVVTEDVGLTITPGAVTKTDVTKGTISDGVATKVPNTYTVQGTSTITSIFTSTPKAATITRIEGSIIIITSPIHPKGATTTISTITSVQPSSTKTTTVKAKSSVTVTTTSYKTTTRKSTITQACVPTAEAQLYCHKYHYFGRRNSNQRTSGFKTTTTTQTVEALQQTVYITKSADVTNKINTTLPFSTKTLYETITEGGGVVTTMVTAEPGTKTVAQKVPATVLQFVTKTAKGAKNRTV